MATKTLDRYIPQNSTEIAHPDGLGVVYCTTSAAGRLSAIGYSGNKSKHDFHYIYRNEEQRQKHIDDYFARLSQWAEIKRERAVARKTPHTLQVGDIIYNTWGWEQTNVDYYQVVRTSDHFVWLRRIAGDVTQDGFMSGYTTPKPNEFLALDDYPITKHGARLCNGENYVGFEHGSGRQYRGGKQYCSWYA